MDAEYPKSRDLQPVYVLKSAGCLNFFFSSSQLILRSRIIVAATGLLPSVALQREPRRTQDRIICQPAANRVSVNACVGVACLAWVLPTIVLVCL